MEYTTPQAQDLQTWLNATSPVPNAATLIRQAALLVGEYLDQCWTIPEDTQPISDATLAQAAYWHTHNITPLSGDVPAPEDARPVQSASLLSGSYTFAGADKEAQARAQASVTLCAEALLLLRKAGLVPAQPIAVG